MHFDISQTNTKNIVKVYALKKYEDALDKVVEVLENFIATVIT